MKNKYYLSISFAILAAVLYAVSTPFSKLLITKMPPAITASLLYLGAGTGMLISGFIRRILGKEKKELHLTRKELPYVTYMIMLDIAAPILLLTGLKTTTSANASLLNNFEIVATSLIALFIFKETIGKRLWHAIGLITLSSLILSIKDMSSFSFSLGSIFVLLACICWGFENNCTRMLSQKDPLEIVVIKGFGSGIGSLGIALAVGERVSDPFLICAALLLGFISYGLSIFFYVYAQRELGAAKTSAYYAIAPFIGVTLSLIIYNEVPRISFLIALLIMIAGTYLTFSRNKYEYEQSSHLSRK
ncbi:MAG: DMT family transporter [Flexilinea sp.]